ncbi:hypothetical protein HQQ94_07405 [Shewanella sp. VB17]|uniref:hypothetical protein n=1 Tax=Shewanella sp. VB17 TaxID=2739432 RepID=UPI001563AD95|nr:hypothetical protein [Shewanella sp. VB17]NRD73069.1 hypothetical protein [Shewanella sp. VB17]
MLKAPVWIATILLYFPSLSQFNRNDVIYAFDLFENGIASIELAQVSIAGEVMERARHFYSNYANVNGAIVGLVITSFIEWVQVQFPDIKQLKFAHVGAGAIALWTVNNIMNEYDRRLHELRAKEPSLSEKSECN